MTQKANQVAKKQHNAKLSLNAHQAGSLLRFPPENI